MNKKHVKGTPKAFPEMSHVCKQQAEDLGFNLCFCSPNGSGQIDLLVPFPAASDQPGMAEKGGGARVSV